MHNRQARMRQGSSRRPMNRRRGYCRAMEHGIVPDNLRSGLFCAVLSLPVDHCSLPYCPGLGALGPKGHQKLTLLSGDAFFYAFLFACPRSLAPPSRVCVAWKCLQTLPLVLARRSPGARRPSSSGSAPDDETGHVPAYFSLGRGSLRHLVTGQKLGLLPLLIMTRGQSLKA
jgi:hypothetical protein